MNSKYLTVLQTTININTTLIKHIQIVYDKIGFCYTIFQ